MSRHLEKVLAHAENKLKLAGTGAPAEILPLYKKFLKIEDYRLLLRHQAGGGGRDICSRRAELIDVLVRHVFDAATAHAHGNRKGPATPLTVVAIGGYGRRELNPYSDVDVMFLHSRSGAKVPAAASETIEQILYLLWDIGFKVGHSTRSVREAIIQSNGDMLTKTAMLEARYLVGQPELFRLFREEFRARCVQGHEGDYIAARMEDQATRHAKFGNSVFLQEPHVKSGCGGLRDYQNLLWMNYFKEGALTTTHLVGKGWLTEADRRRLDASYDFLLRVRTDLHCINRRGVDTLHLNQQPEIARRFRYPQKNAVRRNEAFMKDYYESTRNIFRITERLSEQFAAGGATTSARLFFPFLPRKKTNEDHFGDFSSRKGKLYLNRPDLLTKEPAQILGVFQIAQERGLDLSPELSEMLSRRMRAVTRAYQRDPEAREIFLKILRRKGKVGCALRMMHRVDFLGRYLPEFAPLTCLVQHEFFHRYTADEHTLVCIEKLDELATTEDPKLLEYRKLLEACPDPVVLYLALLLHDTGKGVAARPHSEASALFAQRVATRLQLEPDRRKALVLLVDHHETLSSMAQQRNIDDPSTVKEFAALIRDQSNLDSLMLITLADGQGTSEVWSDWKELLVWRFYRATSRYLTDREGFYEQAKIERETLRVAVSKKLGPEYEAEIEAHFDHMPDHYVRAFKVDEIAEHLDLFRNFWDGIYRRDEPALTPAIQWRSLPAKGHSVVSISTWDVRRLLASIAGAFAVVPLNILSADIYTRHDNLVLDIFRVATMRLQPVTDKHDMALVESTLRSAITDEDFDFGPLLENARRKVKRALPSEIDFPTRITIENHTHPTFTFIRVQTPDRLGLLYSLLSAMSAENIYIALSRISTEKGAAIDTFYVWDAEERAKITDAKRIARLHQALHGAAVPSSSS